MLEALVTSILNRVLGSYVSNLNYDQLKIAVWNGEVNLHDLKLRKDALDKLKLPIDVVEGYLGEMTLSIPWSNLKTKPVKVHIRNVYVLAAPKTEASVNFKDEEERAQQQKQQRLQKAELLDVSKSDVKALDDDKSNNGGGFVSQLTTKIIDNLQLSLENIHIRYEDTVSFPEHRFAAGVTLKELSAISTDDNWQAAFIGNLADTIHKLVKLESLSVYWNTNASSMAGLPHAKASPVYTDFISASGTDPFDHQYIVNPVTGTGKIKLHKSYGKDKPNYDVTLLFDELGFCLDDEQYRDALLLVDLFHSNLKKQEHLKLRPPLGITPKSKPLAYFKYAGDAVLSKIHERNYKWTWDHFKKRRDQRLAYIDCFLALKRNKATSQQKTQLDQLEWDLSFEDIRFYRSIAKNQLRKENITITKQQKTTKKGWFNTLWNRQSNSPSPDQTSSGTESGPVVLTDEQKQELCDVIEYDGYNDGIRDAIDIPKDTMKFVLNTKLKRGSFGLVQHPHTTKQQISSIVFDSVGVEVVKYVESMKISTQLGDLQLYDGITENTLYPQLMGVKKNTTKESITLVGPNRAADVPEGSGTEFTGDYQPLLAIEYQQNPLHKKADKSIKLVMRHLEIIYNPSTIHGILSFFQSRNNDSESFDALIEVAGDTLEGFKRQTRAGLEYALENHSTLELDVDMDAPIVIIPESCVIEDSPVTIIDAGHIRIESDLANQDLAEEFKANHTKDYSVEDFKRLEDLMYDKFHVGLTQIKLLVGQNLRKTMAQLDLDASDDTSCGDDTHVLRRVDIQLLLERCIVPGASQFTKLKVNGQAPLVMINLSTQKCKTLMKAVDLILSPSKDGTTVEATTETQQEQQQQQHKSGHAPQDDLLAKKLWDGRKAKDLLADDENRDPMEHQSVQSPAISDSEIGSSQQTQIKLDFTVTRLSVLISETATSPGTTDTPLCEVVLEQFGLEFVSRPYDMFAHVWLRTLNVVDNMEHGKEYGYLVMSGEAQASTPGPTNDLVDVKYRRVNSKHPMFVQSFGGYEQSVDILLSTLTFVITRDSLLTLYGWIMATFADGTQPDETEQQHDQTERPKLPSRSTNQSSSVSLWSKEGQQSRPIQKSSPASKSKAPKKTTSMKVNIQMLGIQVILNENGVRLCTGILSSGNLEVQLLPSRLRVQGKIGNFVLTDDSSSAIKVDYSDQSSDSAYYLDKISAGKSDVKIISIDDSELLEFTYATFDSNADDFPGHHQHLYVRLGAFRLLYRDALKSISDFFTGFLEMKSVYDSARLTATSTIKTSGNLSAPNKSDQQKECEPSLFAFDIMMQSPIIIFPVGVNHNSKVIAHLGQIHAKNEFVETVRPNLATNDPTPVKANQIRCGLSSISLYSTVNDNSENSDSPILDKVDISVSIENILPPNQYTAVAGPQTSIRGKISNVMMYLSEDQYRWLSEIQQRFSATFAHSSVKDQDNQGVEPSSHPQDQSSSVTFNDPPPDDIQGDSKPVIGTQLDLCFDMGLVCLELFNRSEQGIQACNQHSLGRLSFDSTLMKLEKMTNGPMVLDMQMRSINLYDTRYNSKSCFKDIFPAGKQLDGPQLQVCLKTGAKTEEGNDVTSVDVTLDRPQVVVSLDYMMLLKDFFAAPFETAPPPTEAQAYATSLYVDSPPNSTTLVRPSSIRSNSNGNKSSAGTGKDHTPSKSTLHYKIAVLDLELVCLAHPDISSSEAMVLSFDRLSVIQQDKFGLQLEGIGLLLCRMDKRSESSAQLVDRFGVEIDIQTLTSSAFKNTNINAVIQPIKLRFSYNNVMLIMDIVKKVTALVGKKTNKEDDGFAASSMNDVAEDDDAYDSDLDHMLNMTSLLSEPGDGMTRQVYTAYRHSSDQQKQRPDKDRMDNDQGVKCRESLNTRFEGLQLVIVEDLHDLAFLDLLIEPFNATVSDWSSALVAHARISTQMNNFNFKTSHWEPLIEPYTFELDATRATNVQSLDIGLSSNETLNMNLTHTFLDTLMAVSGAWSAIQPLPGSAQKQIKPFVIENRTGYDMQIWNLLDGNAVDEPSICALNDGQDQDWNSSDWSKQNNSNKVYDNVVGIKVLHADWNAIPAIPIDVEGKRSYCLKNDTDDYQYRVVVEVKLEKHVKSVTFYGGLILENRNASSMEITMMDQSRTLVSPIWTVAPNQVVYSPVGLSYKSWIAVRPSEEYAWCDAPLHWSDMTHPKARTGIACVAIERNCPQYMYHLRGVFDSNNAISRQHPMIKIIFSPPIEIVNHLPFDFKWTMMDQDSNRCFSSVIKYGSSEPLHTFYTDSNLAFVLNVLQEGYGMTELTKIQPSDATAKEGVPITVKTKDGDTTNLRMLLGRGKQNGNSLQIEIYSPYIILNKSSKPISFCFRDSSYSFKSVVSKHTVPACGSKVTPYMFSYPKISPKNRVELSIDGSKWSPALSFEAVGSATDVCMQAEKSLETHAGVHVEEGRGTYHLSKIVTIAPRFVLKNDTDLNLNVSECESSNSSSLGIHGSLPLYNMASERTDKWLCLQLDDPKGPWSTPFDMLEIGTSFTKIPKGDGSRYTLIQVSVAMKNATIFITFKRTTQWPYVIVNNSSTDVTFYQESSQNGGGSKNKKTVIQPTKYNLSPEQKYMKYSWDMPAAKNRRLVLDIGGKTRIIDLHAIGTQIPFRYKKHHPESPSGSVSIDISSHNSSLVLLLTDFMEETSLFRSKSSGESTVSSSSSSVTSAPDHFEPVNIEVVDNYSFGLQLRGVGISVVNSSSQEIIYASIKNMNFKYTDSNLYQSVRTSIEWIQIDNQLFGSPYPILFYPTTLRKNAPPTTDSHPALHLALDKVKDNSHGVTYYKIFSILLQEMTVELDEDLLYALIEFSQFRVKSDQEISNTASDLHNAELDLPAEEPDQSLLFFEQFCIQPMRLNVSFATTAGTGTADASTSANSPIGYLLDEAPVKLNALIIENLRAKSKDLTTKVTTHYKDQFVYQIHRLVGSADLLGNPVGLFTSIGSGVGELFYEPYQGFITSNRPQDFGIGIARGVGGLLKNSVFGLTDSLSKVTGSLGKGLAMATMDKKFQDRRRMKMTRNKPQHAIFGVTQGVTYLGTSLASGVVGLVKRPMEGASESGVGGFFGGVGKGLVGVVTKPVVGICDLASNVTVGLRETTTLFEEGALVKERLPRYTGKDGSLRIFSQQEALGQMWMKEMADGYYSKETYIAHTLIDDEKHACILTWQYLFAINTQKLGVEWFKKLDDLEFCKCTTISDNDKENANNNDTAGNTPRLMIQTKEHPPQNKYINFMDPATAPWFTKHIQKTMQQRMEAREQ